MKIYFLILISTIILSCNQKDIVGDYQRRIASVYSYTQSKINSRNAAPFINNEVLTLDHCLNNLNKKNAECIYKYYSLIQSDIKLKIEQIIVLANILIIDNDQYRLLTSDFKQKIDQLKNKNISANNDYYQSLLSSLDSDYEYYLKASNIFADHIDTLVDQFKFLHSSAIESVKYIARNDIKTQKNLYVELEHNIKEQKKAGNPHPITAYRDFINQLYSIANKKIPESESSKEYSNTAHNQPYNARHLLFKINDKKITNNIYKHFNSSDYRKIIIGIWNSINNIIFKNKTFTHLTILHSHYTGHTHKFVKHIPTNNFCERLKKSSFHEINIPWTDEYLDLFYSSTGILRNGLHCRRFKGDDIPFLDIGKNIGAQCVKKKSRLDVIYEHKGNEREHMSLTPKLYSPPPKMIVDEILRAINY